MLIKIEFSDSDVASLAEESGVSLDVARAKTEEWAGAITDTATALINEQLQSVITTGQP